MNGGLIVFIIAVLGIFIVARGSKKRAAIKNDTTKKIGKNTAYNHLEAIGMNGKVKPYIPTDAEARRRELEDQRLQGEAFARWLQSLKDKGDIK